MKILGWFIARYLECVERRILHHVFGLSFHATLFHSGAAQPGVIAFHLSNPLERPENAFKGAMREIQIQIIITAKHSSSTAHINIGHV